jgi:hypothetical protein
MKRLFILIILLWCLVLSCGCTDPNVTTGDTVFVDENAAGMKVKFVPAVTYFGDYDVWMEYGTTTAYGSSTKISKLSTPLGEEITFAISDLEPGTTYHYRGVMAYTKGKGIEYVNGADRTFTTQESE